MNALNQKNIGMLDRYINPKGNTVRAGKIKFMAKDEENQLLMVHAEPSLMPIAVSLDLLEGGAEFGGYLVVDNTLGMTRFSYMSAMAFEHGHTLLRNAISSGMTKTLNTLDEGIELEDADFSDALMWLKGGKRICRAGWNAGGQWAEIVRNSGLVFRSEFDGNHYEVADGMMLKNAQGAMVQWVPSVGDLLATDWQVVAS